MNSHESELAAHPDAYYHPALNNLPDWLLKASVATRNALEHARHDLPAWHATATREQHQLLKIASTEHWARRNNLEAALALLQNAWDFAEPLLKDAVKKRFGLELDVKKTFLRLYIPQHIPWFSIKSGAAHTWTVSLLDAALHNFQESETLFAAHESASTFIRQPSPNGQFDTLPDVRRKMSVQDFTRLCRELDIGARYESYLKDFLGFNNPVAAAVLKLKVTATHQTALRAALHMAHIREDLPSDAYAAILDLLDKPVDAQLDGQSLRGHDLTMMSSSLTGIVIFATALERARQATRIVVYIPDDPEHPLKQYPDATAFMKDLTRKLRTPAYQAFFSRFVDHQERGHFFADLQRRLSAVTWQEREFGDPLPSWRDTPTDRPNLQFSVTPVRSGLWTHLYQRQLDKLLNDARTVAVSTASADSAARWALWDAFSKIATSLVQVASFVALPFVPFLGEAMLAYMAYQALDEVFEGILDWSEGLRKEAFAHAMTLVSTVVEIGTFAVGTAIAAKGVSRLLSDETRSLFSSLQPVETVRGKTRYWKPDLRPYAQTMELPADARPDSLGLYPHEGKTLLRLEDALYAVKHDSDSGQFRIQHPDRPDAYQPPLRHNHHGAWQSALDQPLTWDRTTVMRRLGPDVESFTDVEREQILRISGFHDNVLRELHVDNQPPPALLTDTIKRYRIDRDIQALIDQSDRHHPEFYQALNQRLSLFESRYRELEKTSDRQVQLLLGEVHGLPTDIAQELVSNTSGSELVQLHQGRVPQRLKDVAARAMEAVRVARAREGFYMANMESADTHRLALHSLETLPDWPSDLRIEVRDYSPAGMLRDSNGPVDAPMLKTLVSAEDGTYTVHDSNASPGDFYHAVLRTLPESERQALGLSINDAPLLKQRIIEHATSRPELRTLFARHPQRKPFYDPTTLRLPGGTDGYLRHHRGTPTLEDRVREVYPGLSGEELQSLVADLQQHPEGARAELSRLRNEFEHLHLDLRRWIEDAPTEHPRTGIRLSDVEHQAEQHNRRLLAQDIQNSWRRQSERDFEVPGDDARYVLRFAEPILGDLPVLTADFSHVSLLVLEGSRAGQGLPGFLQGFKGLRRLVLRRFSLTTLPTALPEMHGLDTVILSDCAIRLDVTAWSQLSSLKHLSTLDLSLNSMDGVPSIEPLAQLVHLNLSHTGLTEIPDSVLRHAKLETLMLRDNQISEVPAALFESDVYEKRGVQLSNNPLSDQARQLIKQSFFETSYDLGVDAPQADIDRVLRLYPNLEFEQASDFIYELPGTLEDGRIELGNLEAEYAGLSTDLSAWVGNLPARHPLTGEPFTVQQTFLEQINRDEFKRALEQCWRHESELDDFNEGLEPTFELAIIPHIHGELPTLNADFSHVTSLTIDSEGGVTRLGGFLDAFANIRSLRLRDCDIGSLPDAVVKMSQLRALSLPRCRLGLSPTSVNALAGMEHLEYLDLSYNPLGLTPDLSQMPGLSTVLLNDTGITEIPRGLLELNDLDWADLSNNAITQVPSDLMEVPADTAANVTLRGNPFTEESLCPTTPSTRSRNTLRRWRWSSN